MYTLTFGRWKTFQVYFEHESPEWRDKDVVLDRKPAVQFDGGQLEDMARGRTESILKGYNPDDKEHVGELFDKPAWKQYFDSIHLHYDKLSPDAKQHFQALVQTYLQMNWYTSVFPESIKPVMKDGQKAFQFDAFKGGKIQTVNLTQSSN